MLNARLDHELYDTSADRLAALVENMDVTADPVPASRAKTTFPGKVLLAVIVCCIAVATIGNWFYRETLTFNDIIVKFLAVLIPLLLIAFGFFIVRFFGFLRANSIAEQEALAEAEAEVLNREARFAAGRIKGDRRLCIRPLNPAKRAARRRRADKLRTV